jgi:glycolate oxidase iron-sulfur subunit
MTGGGRGGFEGLDACVHCGFCLQACPTFLATGDEADSPRGRIELIRALERGDLPPTDPSLAFHLDRCLGCRGCEPVCPSGVRYGQGLEAARALLTRAHGVPWIARAALWALTTPEVSGVVYGFARALRAWLPRWLAGWGRLRFAMGMLVATKGGKRREGAVGGGNRGREPTAPYRPLPPFSSAAASCKASSVTCMTRRSEPSQ